MHANIQSIKCKTDRIDAFVKSCKPEILCFTEHWLLNEDIEYVKIQGYVPISSFCRKTTKHGGVIILAKEGLCTKPIQIDPDLILEKDFEISAMELNSNFGKYIFLCVYRSPSGNFDIFLENLTCVLLGLKSQHKQIILCGDFNTNFNSKCKKAQLLVDTLRSFGLLLRVIKNTRITKTSETCIDNIFTSNEHGSIDVIDAGLSDHCVQLLSIIKQPEKNKADYVQRRTFKKEQIDSFGLALSLTSWDKMYEIESVNDMFDEFMNIFNALFDDAFPLKTTRINNQNKSKTNWYTKDLHDLSKEVIKLYATSKSAHSTAEEKKIYHELLKKYQILIQENKKGINIRKIKSSDNKSKQAWAVIENNKNKPPTNNNIELELKLNDNTIERVTKPTDVANIFNDFFKEAATNTYTDSSQYAKNQPLSFSRINHHNKNFFLAPVTSKEILDAFDKVTKKKKAAGFDNIPGHILKHVAVFLVGPLMHILNVSFSTGTFPEKLKKAIISPLHKKGCRESVQNYRPIAILSIFSKIFEKCFCNKLINFLDKYNLISERQHGFRNGKSTTSAMLSFINDVYTSLSNQQSSIGVFYDLSKAFDMVDHKILIEKLQTFGIIGLPNDWIKSYLSNRCYITKITNSNVPYYSNEVITNIGVPQGSIISPLLFILYTNDIVSCTTHSQLTLFADDTTQFLTNDLTQNSIDIQKNNIAVQEISQWVTANKLALNKSKTVLMQFHPKNDLHRLSSPLLYLNNKSIIPQNSTKFLGVIVDNKLQWGEHIDAVCKKVASGCFLIKRLMQICDIATAKLVYYAYLHSRLAYGILLWGMSHHTKRLFALQKRSIRYLAQATADPCTTGMFYKDSCKPYFIKFQILTLPCIFIYSAVCLIIENKQLTTECNPTHRYLTRNSHVLKTSKILSKFDKKNPIQISIKLYNKAMAIFNTATKEPNGCTFRNYVKTFLINNAFYSIDQFLSFDTSIPHTL